MKRYPWLDGMRGLAALYVLLYHAASEVGTRGLPTRVVDATSWLRHGHSAVAVFIVLSGFSLMLPVVREGAIRGGFRGYLARRSRRILPPYYAALALSLLLIAASTALQSPQGDGYWYLALPAIEAGPILSHLLMVHDLDRAWLYKIDPPMWSVAVEWQIYFLFPVLALAWRRAGHPASLVLALSATHAATSLMGAPLARLACPWYAALFAFGMLAASATATTTDRPIEADRRRSWPLWVVASAMTFDLCFSSGLIRGDMILGLATAGVLAGLSRADRGVVGIAGRLLGSRPIAALGAISYSLYLVHFPLLALASNLMLGRGVGATSRLALLLFVASPIVLAFSYAFHLAFERPFLHGPRRDSKAAGTTPASLAVVPEVA